jgi:signal transduction histidine kinase
LKITSELALPAVRIDGGLGRDLETTIYRVIQEALTNVIKHARADTARVSISTADGEVKVEVEDNGVGFDSGNATTGFGLAGIRERVSLAGGTVDVASTGNGTLVTARLPAPAAGGSANR